MSGCLHREGKKRRCLGCRAWLSTGNPLDICAQCNGGTWDIGAVPESIWEKVLAARNQPLAADALADLMSA